jgi:hypothetical protein
MRANAEAEDRYMAREDDIWERKSRDLDSHRGFAKFATVAGAILFIGIVIDPAYFYANDLNPGLLGMISVLAVLGAGGYLLNTMDDVRLNAAQRIYVKANRDARELRRAKWAAERAQEGRPDITEPASYKATARR